MEKVTSKPVPSLRAIRPDVSPELEQAVLQALSRDPDTRFQTAREFARAIEESVEGGPATAPVVGEWVEELAKDRLDMLDTYLHEIERALPSDEDDARASVRRVAEEDLDGITVDVPGASRVEPPRSAAPPHPVAPLPRVSDMPTSVAGTAPGGVGADTALPLFAGQDSMEQDTAVDPMTDKLRPYKDRHSAASLPPPKPPAAEPATPEQVIASVLERPAANPTTEAAPAEPDASEAPWTGPLFEGESSIVMTHKLEDRLAVEAPLPLPTDSTQPAPAEKRPTPGKERLPVIIGVGLLVVLVLVLVLVAFVSEAAH